MLENEPLSEPGPGELVEQKRSSRCRRLLRRPHSRKRSRVKAENDHGIDDKIYKSEDGKLGAYTSRPGSTGTLSDLALHARTCFSYFSIQGDVLTSSSERRELGSRQRSCGDEVRACV